MYLGKLLELLIIFIGCCIASGNEHETVSNSVEHHPASTSAFERFEFKVSFKGPHLVHKDGVIPFWELQGHAIGGESYVRLTPSMPNMKGAIWSKKLGEFGGFRIDTTIRVTGKGRIGGDGMAIWYLEEKPDPNTNPLIVLGGPNHWKGLGIFLDSYDNDGKQDSPKVGGYVSTGNVDYNHDSDGYEQDIGHCVKDYRNRPYPVKIRITYFKQVLTVKVNNGISSETLDTDFELCFEKANVVLPGKGYFGVSAATGAVSDDHDVFGFTVHSLRDSHAPDLPGPSEEERKKYEAEYKEYDKLLKDQMNAIEKNTKLENKDINNKAEDEAARNFRQIWEEQTHIRTLLVDMNARVQDYKDDLIVQIRSLHTAMDALRAEVNSLRNSVSAPKDVGSGYAIQELKDSLSQLSKEITMITHRQEQIFSSKTTTTDCATSSVIIVILSVQTLVLLGLMLAYLKKQETSKKFY